ncbi:MAG: flavodoxin family protein [Firmicutes bacterium]|nr:flavodoxin family protein [Bacillota bacterium]
MKVLMLNGSRREKGCTYTALSEVASALEKEGIESEIFFVGEQAVKGDIDSLVKTIKEKMEKSDGLVVGSPVYFAGPTAEIKAVLDRLFMGDGSFLKLKPAAAVASARRGGTTATLDVLNKYFSYAQMPIVSSRYWNMVHGSTPEDVEQDTEGLQIIRVLGKNMAWLLKCIEAGKNNGIPAPEAEDKIFTNFIKK